MVHCLAQDAGIQVAEGTARRFSSIYHTFLTKRFDRTPAGDRIHFASAMTLLGYSDGQDHVEGISYLELAEFISTYSAAVQEDLEQLWRRIVFSICVSNIDDHVRNHGFILTPGGWRLSPAYDINPVETGTGLKLNISENDNSLDLALAMEVIPFFRIKKEKALQIIKEVKHAVSSWKMVAKDLAIPQQQIEMKARAFRIAHTT